MCLNNNNNKLCICDIGFGVSQLILKYQGKIEIIKNITITNTTKYTN